MRERRRAGWPELAVLLVFLAGSSYVAYQTHRALVDPPPPRPRPALEASDADPTTWVHHAWIPDAGAAPLAPPPPVAPLAPPAQDEVYDPQRWAMVRAFGLAGDAGDALPFAPIERSARITSLRGQLPFGRAAACDVRVLPVRSGAFDCLVRVRCGDHVVYPNPTQTAGYVRCERDDEGGFGRIEDAGHSALDGDPRLRLELALDEVHVSDEGDGVAPFELTLRLL
ncbi:MAG: hypothetical protein KF729_24690 [Sandaracinaceae bacterium]|nr:hypothetical protein [Sandaracinaceae bacterium]